MSNRAINAVFDYSKTRGSPRLLLVAIADGVNPDTSAWRARIETLQARMNQPNDSGRRYIKRMQNKLLAAGELVLIERTGHANEYVIPILEGEPGYAPEECASDEHACNGWHTPLDVSREQVKRDEIRAQRRRSGRKGGANRPPHDDPQGETAQGGGLLTPRGGSIDPPGGANRPPRGGQGTPHYPSLTPRTYPSVTDGPTASEKNEGRQSAERTPPTPPAPPPAPTATGQDADDDEGLKPAPELWGRVVATLADCTTLAQRDSWLSPAQLLAPSDPARPFVLVPRTTYAAGMLETRYRERIALALGRLTRRGAVAVEVRRVAAAAAKARAAR